MLWKEYKRVHKNSDYLLLAEWRIERQQDFLKQAVAVE